MNSSEHKQSSGESGVPHESELQSQRFFADFGHGPKDTQHQQKMQQLQQERIKQQQNDREQWQRHLEKIAADGQRDRARDGNQAHQH